MTFTDSIFLAAARRDMPAATTSVGEALRDGRSVSSVLAALAGVQLLVGERWYRDEWSVADEHAATATVDAALAVVEAFVGRTGPGPAPISVVVACPEGEWHALPARLFATELRSLGADVTFLGASMPADHLARYVGDHRTDLVALSVSTALGFGAAARSIDAVRRVGVPTVVGGPAFGSDDRRARALGADGWSPDAGGMLRDPLFGPGALRVAARRRDRESQLLRIELDRPSLVDAAMGVLGRRIPTMAAFERSQLAATRQDLDHIAHFAAAAILVEDRSLFVDFIGWLGPLLAARGVPALVVGAALDALIEVSSDHELCAVLRTGVAAQS